MIAFFDLLIHCQITNQLEADIREEVRIQFEDNLVLQQGALEEKVRVQCSEEIEERLSVVQKDTIELYKLRKKQIEEKERALSAERKRFEHQIEAEIRGKHEAAFAIERERVIQEVSSKLDRTRLICEVESELKKEITRDLLVEKEKEIKRKETILKLNYKKKFEAERAQLDEQIQLEFDELVQAQLDVIAQQRNAIAAETAEKHSRISQLQADKKSQTNLLAKSREKHASIIEDLQAQIASLSAIRDQLGLVEPQQQSYSQTSQSQMHQNSNFSRGNSVSPQSRTFRSTSPPIVQLNNNNNNIRNPRMQSTRNNNNNVNNSNNQSQQSSSQLRNSQQQQQNSLRINAAAAQQMSNNNNNNSNSNNNSGIQQNQQQIQQRILSDRSASTTRSKDTNRNNQNTIGRQSSLRRQDSGSVYSSQRNNQSGSQLYADDSISQGRSQPASSYLSDKINTVVEDLPNNLRASFGAKNGSMRMKETSDDDGGYNSDEQRQKQIKIQQMYQKNNNNNQENDENDINRNVHNTNSSISSHSINAQNAKKIATQSDLKDRVADLLSDIKNKYTPDLRNDIEDFILSATAGSAGSANPAQTRAARGLAEEHSQQQNASRTNVARQGSNNNNLQTYTSSGRHGSLDSQEVGYGAGEFATNRMNNNNNQNNPTYTSSLVSPSGQQQQRQSQTYQAALPRNQQFDRNSSRFEDWTSQSGRRNDDYDEQNAAAAAYNNMNDDDDNDGHSLNSSSSSVELERELRANNKERVRPREIMNEDALWNYLIQQKTFPSSKQYALLWKHRPTDTEEDKEIKAIKVTIDYILEEEREYCAVFEAKIAQFERDIPVTVRRYAEDTWTQEDVEAKIADIQNKLSKLKLYWKVCDTSYKERISTMSTFFAHSCMINKLERSLRDAVDVMDIVRNNTIVVRIGQALQERQRLMDQMKSEFCLNNYRKYKEDLKTIQQQINVLNSEYQITDQKGKKSTGSRLTRGKNNVKQLFWKNIKLSDVIRIDKWEEQKLQICLIRLKLQGYK